MQSLHFPWVHIDVQPFMHIVPWKKAPGCAVAKPDGALFEGPPVERGRIGSEEPWAPTLFPGNLTLSCVHRF